MEIMRTAKPVREMADVKIWHCRGCGVVHMSVKGMVLNFNRQEFATFTDAVVDINYSGWFRDERLFDLGEHDFDVHSTAVVH